MTIVSEGSGVRDEGADEPTTVTACLTEAIRLNFRLTATSRPSGIVTVELTGANDEISAVMGYWPGLISLQLNRPSLSLIAARTSAPESSTSVTRTLALAAPAGSKICPARRPRCAAPGSCEPKSRRTHSKNIRYCGQAARSARPGVSEGTITGVSYAF